MKKNLPIYMTPRDWKESYEAGIPHWAQDLKPSLLARKLLNILPRKNGNRILEIGVGNGRDSIFFAQNNNEVFGIDIVANAVKMARKNAEQAGVSGATKFKVGNAENLSFKDKIFDAVYSVSVMHSANLKKSISEVARVLKNKGKAIIYLYELIKKNGQRFVYYPQDEVERIMRDNSLVINDSWSKWQTEHKNERTKILIFELTKK